MTQASALILNTFDELEAPIVTKLATIFPKVYTIGPLHTLLKTQMPINNQDGQLRKEDKSCITWLDHQKANLKPFLWVIRSDLITGGENLGHDNVPLEVQLGTKERVFIVDWAPQEEVLAHPAVVGTPHWNVLLKVHYGEDGEGSDGESDRRTHQISKWHCRKSS
ncbi:Cytokinin-O-glucosyltransferase 2 [Sesbania bispinosa]|nr:Cytokinin-O-glucosyltransferase 2 [Sesbania bispinosa]